MFKVSNRDLVLTYSKLTMRKPKQLFWKTLSLLIQHNLHTVSNGNTITRFFTCVCPFCKHQALQSEKWRYQKYSFTGILQKNSSEKFCENILENTCDGILFGKFQVYGSTFVEYVVPMPSVCWWILQNFLRQLFYVTPLSDLEATGGVL